MRDGERVEADVVVVGIGFEPAIRLAVAAGLSHDNGINVDFAGRTSSSYIFAAGDVCNQPDFIGGRVRHESFRNADEQGAAVARAMLGHLSEYPQPASFWSDQYDLNIQVPGRIIHGADVIQRGHLDSG